MVRSPRSSTQVIVAHGNWGLWLVGPAHVSAAAGLQGNGWRSQSRWASPAFYSNSRGAFARLGERRTANKWLKLGERRPAGETPKFHSKHHALLQGCRRGKREKVSSQDDVENKVVLDIWKVYNGRKSWDLCCTLFRSWPSTHNTRLLSRCYFLLKGL